MRLHEVQKKLDVRHLEVQLATALSRYAFGIRSNVLLYLISIYTVS